MVQDNTLNCKEVDRELEAEKKMNMKSATVIVSPCASVMEWNKWFFYAYCVFVLSTPEGNSVYSVLVQSITYLLSFPQFHFIRAFIQSGSPASKTVIHGLVTTCTYYTQLFITNGFLLVLFGCFKESVKDLLHNYPHNFCVLAIPIFLKPVLITLMFLAFFKSLMTVKIEIFLNLNHETTLKLLNVAIGIMWVGMITGDLILRGTLCNPNLATASINHIIGIQVVDKYFESKTKAPPYFPIGPFIMAMGLLCYVCSLIIKKTQDLRKKQQTRRVKPIAIFKASPGRESLHENDEQINQQSGDTFETQPRTLPQIIFVRPVSSDAGAATTGENQASMTLHSIPVPLSHVMEPLNLEGKDLSDLDSLNENSKSVAEEEIHTENGETTVVELEEDKTRKANHDLGPVHKMATLPTSGSIAPDDVVLTLEENISLADKHNVSAPSTASSIPSTATSIPSTASSIPSTASSIPSTASSIPSTASSISWPTVGISILVMISIILFQYAAFGQKSNSVIYKFTRFLFQCLPMYWVLMVDDCYQLTRRRTKTWLANTFSIYWD